MISIFYGTRPEYIKLYKLYTEMKNANFECELVKVNQHTTLIEDCYFDRLVDITTTDTNRLNSIIQQTLNSKLFASNTTHVIVQGDTATSFGIALNAFHNKIKIIHIEAGLRTWDKENPYPEETYRKCISNMADVHFCVSELNKQILQNEKVNGTIHVVGNTVLDNLDTENVFYGNIVPITLHRRENKDRIEKILKAIDEVALNFKHLHFVYIKHPSINVDDDFKNIFVMPPQSYPKMINLLKQSKFIITDSGGIQEEASFFKKRTIVVRKETERKEGLEIFSVLAFEPIYIRECIKDFDKYYEVSETCPYGDGKAVEKIIKTLKQYTNETF
jgi:UDP-N-acetylglucosamine 2-epimerase (non-hydrolysing)